MISLGGITSERYLCMSISIELDRQKIPHEIASAVVDENNRFVPLDYNDKFVIPITGDIVTLVVIVPKSYRLYGLYHS
jgi:hypothetical protein